MTTSNHQQIDLPKIPSLPPIEMPDTSSFLEPVDFLADKSSPLHPSSVSLLSQDTFMTADSSSFSELIATPTTSSPELVSPVSPLTLVSIPTLRKSLSVDSFTKHRPPSDSITRTARGNTVGASSRPITGRGLHNSQSSSDSRTEVASSRSSAEERSDWERRPFRQPAAGPSRSRGASVSTTTGDELGDSFYDESDMERSEDLISVARTGKSRLRRPGDLSLPSRLQTASSSPTMGKTPPPIVPERSSSLQRPHLKKQRSLISVNTQLPSSPHSPSTITIAVIGSIGSGKTALIRKGLKMHSLSEATNPLNNPGMGGEAIRYLYRIARLSRPYVHADCILRILEVDILSLELGKDNSIFPEGAIPVDGLVFCYDATNPESFKCVPPIMSHIAPKSLPTITFACKTDLAKRVDTDKALRTVEKFDVGVIETSVTTEAGKQKIRDGWDFLIKTILGIPLSGGRERSFHRNPASPAVLTSPPLEISRASSATPTASSAGAAYSPTFVSNGIHSSHVISTSEDSSHNSTSASRTRSMSDLLSEREPNWDTDGRGQSVLGMSGTRSRTSSHSALPGPEQVSNSLDDGNEPSQSVISRESRPPRWLTLDELLDKLLFVAVSEDDPTFISHFLLTYRRFAIPRSILLAMQKRMRSLDQANSDPMFACYAQMKICWLLDHWISLYPSDFAVAGTTGALSALIKSIIGKTYLLHYGSVFIPFLETLPKLKDEDTSWALKVEEPKDDSDDASSVADAHVTTSGSPVSSRTSHSLHDSEQPAAPSPPPPPTNNIPRGRKSSLPLHAKILMSSNSPTQSSHSSSSELTWSKKLKALSGFAAQFTDIDISSVAQEISRAQCRSFLEIKPRHWLQHVVGRGEKDSKGDTITRYNRISHHIANWVVSLILSQDKPRARAKLIDRFVELANRLRNMNNYSALRAVIAGINSAAYETDATMQQFRQRYNPNFKQFQSFDNLLQAVRAHSKYRLALRNSKGPCIPALEIHLSDLIRAHEGNSDFHDDDPTHIHWEKWNMMGRFIDGITQCQQACREDTKYEAATGDVQAKDVLLLDKTSYLMDEDQRNERIELDKTDPDELQPYREPPPHPKEGIRKIFFW
ncbi:ras guanine nucleotide exchange factor domain-containing protein [Irpex rosettiformis]|uniref:Ras guanine nucleotide exchange factor domain-containing protein n=1 Tax=Irpex rosettiformis TaxID=378272 RepID=A0ACB8UKN8_9APHY|nr:ras guanine nucleotide exchange factor domain-containing protein [Irpex rosettiformis]